MNSDSGADDNEAATSTTPGDDDSFSPLQQIVCSIIPPLSSDLHKGQAGRIAVIGGSRDFTGAPYFAGISSLKVGADLSYVICTQDAAPAIKCYSPELMVYPILDSANAIDEVASMLPKIHAVVIGPGLGREQHLLAKVGGIIDRVKEHDLPMIIDADGLYFISLCPDIVRGYIKTILTPNMAEFDRLYAAVYRSEPNRTESANTAVQQLCQTLGNVTIVRKGPSDVISDGHNVVECTEPGSARRCGGQGDILAGALGTFTYWSQKAFGSRTRDLNLHSFGPNVVAALGGCMLTRRCNRLAFNKLGRSAITTDMISEIRNAFSSLFPVD